MKQVIYNIVAAERIEKVLDYAHLEGTVNWGFYFDLDVARDVVKNNMTDLHEGCYEYIAIEAQEEGIARHVPDTMEFYRYDATSNTYVLIDTPEGFEHTCGLNM